MTKRIKKPCDRCGLCDLARFVGWRERVEHGLGQKINERSKRFLLVQEIHEDIARRYPLGIAVTLAQAVANLACCEPDGDEDAVMLLADIETDERQSVRLNGTRGHCAASVLRWQRGELEAVAER